MIGARGSALLFVALVACRPDPAPPVADPAPSAAATPAAASSVPAAVASSTAAGAAASTGSAPSPSSTPTEGAATCAAAAIAALDKKDMRRLAELAHPTQGVRFTPFGFVRPAEDVVLRRAELAGAMTDPKVRNWGILGESDDPIKMTFAEFYARFVYDAPFARLGPAAPGTTASFESASHNVDELRKTLHAAYPRATVSEYRKPSASTSVPDWRVLRLVCQEHEGKQWLVGIVHSEWTP